MSAGRDEGLTTISALRDRADALHRAGRLDDALAIFEEADLAASATEPVRLGMLLTQGKLLTVASSVEALLVAGALILAEVSAPSGIGSGSGPAQYGPIVLLGLAMGLQNATARHLAAPDLTTTVLTLTITGIAADSHLTGGAGSRVGRRGLAVLAMFLGAVIGGLLVVGGRAMISLVLALLVLGIVAASAAAVSRANPSWARAT